MADNVNGVLHIWKTPGSVENQYESVESHLARKRVLFLRGTIVPVPYRVDNNGPTKICDMIMAMATEDTEKPIWLVIDSPGGDMETGYHLYDIMKLSPAPIYTVGQSCASMASIILAAGEQGHRYVLPNARIMIHSPSGAVEGKVAEMANYMAEMNKINERMVQTYLECGVSAGVTKVKSKAKLIKDLGGQDYWMHAKEAVDYGLSDSVVDRDIFREMLVG